MCEPKFHDRSKCLTCGKEPMALIWCDRSGPFCGKCYDFFKATGLPAAKWSKHKLDVRGAASFTATCLEVA